MNSAEDLFESLHGVPEPSVRYPSMQSSILSRATWPTLTGRQCALNMSRTPNEAAAPPGTTAPRPHRLATPLAASTAADAALIAVGLKKMLYLVNRFGATLSLDFTC